MPGSTSATSSNGISSKPRPPVARWSAHPIDDDGDRDGAERDGERGQRPEDGPLGEEIGIGARREPPLPDRIQNLLVEVAHACVSLMGSRLVQRSPQVLLAAADKRRDRPHRQLQDVGDLVIALLLQDSAGRSRRGIACRGRRSPRAASPQYAPRRVSLARPSPSIACARGCSRPSSPEMTCGSARLLRSSVIASLCAMR